MSDREYKIALWNFEEAMEEIIKLEKQTPHHFYSLGLEEAYDLLQLAIEGKEVEDLIKHYTGDEDYDIKE